VASAAEIVYNHWPMTADEKSLVRAAQHGSLEAFEQLFRRHERRIYTLALHMVGDVNTAEDLTQDTFVRAWENLRRLRHGQAFSGWLRRIVLNLVWDYIRHRPAAEGLKEEHAERLADPADPPGLAVSRGALARRVRQAVLSLPEHQRLVVAMFYWEDMPVNEIARVLGIARGTVISRLARGRETLRRKLGPALSVPAEVW